MNIEEDLMNRIRALGRKLARTKQTSGERYNLTKIAKTFAVSRDTVKKYLLEGITSVVGEENSEIVYNIYFLTKKTIGSNNTRSCNNAPT